jgi:hypothetical protein
LTPLERTGVPFTPDRRPKGVVGCGCRHHQIVPNERRNEFADGSGSAEKERTVSTSATVGELH